MGAKRSSGPDCLLVCAGKDCRGAKGFGALMDVAGDLPHAYSLPCQGLCHGPIAGVRIGGRTFWHERVRTGKVRKQLVRAVERGSAASGLRELEVRSHRDVIKGAKRARSIGRKSVDLVT